MNRCGGEVNGFSIVLVLGLVLLWSSSVSAHVESGRATDPLGLRHPGQVSTMCCHGRGGLGAQHKPGLWLLPVTFPMVMSLGADGIARPAARGSKSHFLSAILLGAMVLGNCDKLIAPAGRLFRHLHGHAHGTELPPRQNGLLYSLGFVLATGMLHGLHHDRVDPVAGRPGNSLCGAGPYCLMGVTFLRALS
jgi:urease accessory protein